MVKKYRAYIYFPVILSIVLVLGIWLGSKLNFSSKAESPVFFSFPTKRINKLNEVINYIESEYVDSVSRDELTDKTIQNLLRELDPHSYYIPAQDLQAVNEPLEGNFSGIGIEFSIQKDTVVVITPISGGPSELLGIEAGDRIVKVNRKNMAGTGIANNDVMDLLRGRRGTKVNISILRKGVKKLLDFTITRDKIPIFSVDVSYMLSEDIGYIKLSRFSKNTLAEFLEAGKKLKAQGLKKLVLDLRQNGGGFLDVAIKLGDEFLSKGTLIVFTEGRARTKESYYAEKKGEFENTELIILIDEGSASASEIIAGAIQDNDRGIIIGRRTFGKGLVQEQTPPWPDGSAIRLTVARYYTPTGRCIQKPYDEGTRKYYMDYYEGIANGNSQTTDSIVFPDSLKYSTPKGKVVYGGGGIMPDILIPYDTSGFSHYFSELRYKGIIRQFAFEYTDRKRNEFASYGSFDNFNKKFIIESKLFDDLIAYATEKGVEKDASGIDTSREKIINRLKAAIARNVWHNDGFYPIIQQKDMAIKKAVEILNAQ